MFHIFNNQDERRAFGGSGFLELQYCRLASGTGMEDIVSVDSIDNWKDDSLYVHWDDIRTFLRQYQKAFGNATYNNLTQGPLDVYGINYYSPEQLEKAIAVICDEKPTEYENLLEWIDKGKEYNGIYILGI